MYDDFSKTIEESFKSTFSNTVIDTTLLFEEVDYGTGFITLLLGTHIEMTLDDTTIRTSEEDLDTNFLIGGEIGYLFHLVESNVFTLYLGPSFGLQYNTIESTEYLNVRDTYGYYTILITETSKMSNFKPYIGLNLDARFYFTERFYINAGVDGIISYNFFNITLSRDGNGDNILSEFTGAERVKDEAMTIGAKAFGASIRPTISIGYRF